MAESLRIAVRATEEVKVVLCQRQPIDCKNFNRCSQRSPDDTFLLYGLALEFKKQGEPRKAIELLNRVIDLDWGYCYAYHQRVWFTNRCGDLPAARRAYRAWHCRRHAARAMAMPRAKLPRRCADRLSSMGRILPFSTI